MGSREPTRCCTPRERKCCSWMRTQHVLVMPVLFPVKEQHDANLRPTPAHHDLFSPDKLCQAMYCSTNFSDDDSILPVQ